MHCKTCEKCKDVFLSFFLTLHFRRMESIFGNIFFPCLLRIERIVFFIFFSIFLQAPFLFYFKFYLAHHVFRFRRYTIIYVLDLNPGSKHSRHHTCIRCSMQSKSHILRSLFFETKQQLFRSKSVYSTHCSPQKVRYPPSVGNFSSRRFVFGKKRSKL